MDEAWKALLMALASVSFVELTWAIERFDGLLVLGGPAMQSGRGLQLFRDTVDRYLMVFAAVLALSAMMTMAVTYAPELYSAEPGQGMPSSIESGSMFAPVHLLFWLVVAAMVGRWAALTYMESRHGERTVRWLRERMVLPGSKRRGEEVVTAGSPGEGIDWDEEAPLPEVPAPHA
jgi:hypothetical protein